MIRISNIKIAAHKEQGKVLEQEICRLLHIKSLQGMEYHVVKKSVDARKKESIQCIYTVDVTGIKDEAKVVAQARLEGRDWTEEEMLRATTKEDGKEKDAKGDWGYAEKNSWTHS